MTSGEVGTSLYKDGFPWELADKAYTEAFKIKDVRQLPFDTKAAKSSPMLRPKGVNRILLYPGSFNPPHKGHWTLLNHAFENAGDDLQLSAAIILPTDDRRIAVKTSVQDEPLILPRDQRVQLWNEANVLTDQMWVFNREEKDWAIFRIELEKVFMSARVEVNFITLVGPDYVRQSTTTDPTYWSVKDTITSDISRPIDFVTASGQLQKVYPCSNWTRPKWDRERFRAQYKAKMRGKSATAIEDVVEEADKKMERIWICHRLIKPKGTIRFIWTGRSVAADKAPSSKSIREVFKSKANNDLETELASVALSPALLAKFVQEHVPNEALQKLQIELREKAALKEDCDWRDGIAW